MQAVFNFINESHMAKFQAIICHRSFVEIKVLGLRYVAGAIHGKSLKRKTTKNDDKREKTKKYEENRKEDRNWDHALVNVNCVCSGKWDGQLITKGDRPGEVREFVVVFCCLYVPE
jgi:hypothetical protein